MSRFTANIAGVGRCRVSLADDRIQSVERLGPEVAQELYCSPGFIDLQINGFAGLDFSAANLKVEDIARALPAIWATGCTTICPTLITNSIDRLTENFSVLEQARRDLPEFALSAPCYHLEGPYLSPGPSHGAHDPAFMHEATVDEFLCLQSAAAGKIGILTLAPEIPGTIELTHHASQEGVIVAISHSDGRAEDIYRAVTAGATLSTHWGNGCPAIIHRHDAPLWAQLACDDLYASIICDGFHLPPEHVQIVERIKGPARCILVTDAIHVAQLPPGRYALVGREIELQPSGRVITVDGQSMAGSSLSMSGAVWNFIQMTGVPLSRALRAATEAPAQLLRRHRVCRTIQPGQLANLVLFQVGPNGFEIDRTILAGRVVHPAKSA